MFRLNLRDNLPLKIFSLLLAVVCWVVVRSEEERVRDYVVPLDYVNLPESTALSGAVIDSVGVRLRASEAVLQTITEDRLSAAVDLSHTPPGEHHIRLSEGIIKVPAGAVVERIAPALIPIRIEKRAQREVPVHAEFAGRPAAGFRMAGHVIEPPQVTIEGPESEAAAVRRVLTGTIVLEGASGDLEVEVRPVPDVPAGSRVRIVSPRVPVQVRVTIEPEPAAGDGHPADPGSKGRPA